ncbi:MAG TPA: BT_3928 family protein [Ferruginibacter sp.]|nr:BT_3928 family protein [Ferruginibacter sp.]
MKQSIKIARIITGVLFIFSGLVKAIDPLGLGYKMREFFEAWANDGFLKGLMHNLNEYALFFSVVMITLEVVVGAALLLGWQKKLTTWLLLLLMIFFTFLTSYVLFTGKIRACGCFGDCIPLTPVQTFTKDIILLLLACMLLINRKHIHPVAKPWINSFYILLVALLTLLLQWYVLKHLPLVDCLPYKKGNDILKLRQLPADAVMDKYDYTFIYEKNGEKREFPSTALPDSTWKFSDRSQKLVEKGRNNVPVINDFSLTAQDGSDVTTTILSDSATYYLFFINEVDKNSTKWISGIRKFIEDSSHKVYAVTSQKALTSDFLLKNNIPVKDVLTVDATALKTVARTNPALYKMKGPVVQNKWSWADFDEVE